MARGGHKYPLIVYQHMLNRWWPALIAMGLGMFALAYSEYIDPMARFLPWRWQLFAGIGALAVLIGVFFLILRHLAYVQPFPEYLKLVTPFMRINISYKRIKKTTTTEMRYLFPFKSLSDWMRFSSELESMRSGIDIIPSAPQKRQKRSILSQLPKK